MPEPPTILLSVAASAWSSICPCSAAPAPVATRSCISTLMCESVCIYCISDLNYHFQPLPTFSVLTLSFSNIDYSDSCFSVSDRPKKYENGNDFGDFLTIFIPTYTHVNSFFFSSMIVISRLPRINFSF
jgi:hypothetical protein